MFLDSNSITLTLQLLGYFFFKPIIFCVKYKIKFKKLLVFKVLDLIKTSENKIEFKELDIAGVFTVKTFVDNEFLFELQQQPFAAKSCLNGSRQIRSKFNACCCH